DEYELVERILDAVDARDRTLLIIDDADVWRAQTMSDRKLLTLWERLERLADRGAISGTRLCLTVARGSALPSSLATRISQTWRDTGGCAGRFVVTVDGMTQTVQLARMPEMSTGETPIGCVRTLPTFIASQVEPRSVVAITARRLESMPAPIDSMAASGVFAVLGSRRSGRSWAVRRIADACRDLGRDVMVIDDADRVDVDPVVVNRAVRGEIVIVASVDPATLRARPDHWLNVVRRVRSGLLLGRSAHDDADLLGLFAVPESMVAHAVGRGLWVDRGTVIDVVQMIEPVDGP
ncbi:MAG: hypothetical protein RIU67_173, partial [Actinomycetota bacterium]